MGIQIDKKTILMQAKQVVMTSYNITAVENRFFYYLLFSAQKEKNGVFSCRIKSEELKRLALNASQKTIPAIKKALNSIKGTSLLFEIGSKDCDYNLIGGHEYDKDKDEFYITFLPRLYEYIINYSVYAPLNLDILGSFKSFYTQRLYELLRLWSRTGTEIRKSFTIDELRFVLGVEDKHREYKALKQRVIIPATKEINEKGNMMVEILEIKEGRKVAKIEFKILDHETKKYFNGSFKTEELEEQKITENQIKEIKEPVANSIHTQHKKANSSNIENIIDFSNKGILLKINRKFKNYDFTSSEELEDIVLDAFSISLEKDNNEYEDINIHNVNFFIETLKNKLMSYEAKKNNIDFDTTLEHKLLGWD